MTTTRVTSGAKLEPADASASASKDHGDQPPSTAWDYCTAIPPDMRAVLCKHAQARHKQGDPKAFKGEGGSCWLVLRGHSATAPT